MDRQRVEELERQMDNILMAKKYVQLDGEQVERCFRLYNSFQKEYQELTGRTYELLESR